MHQSATPPRRSAAATGGASAAGVRKGTVATHKRTPHAIAIDPGLCKACGICAALCPEQVFDRDELGNPIVARLGDCISCSFCERHCPDFAIEIEWEPATTAGGKRR